MNTTKHKSDHSCCAMPSHSPRAKHEAKTLGQQATVYTCPMHPEVRQEGPGSCPKCGMALEPLAPAAEEGADPELTDMSRRFWVGAALSLPLLLSMTVAIPGWLQFLLATPVVLWAGAPFFRRGWDSLRTRQFNMFTLIVIGSGAAYAFSLFALFFPEAIPHDSRGHGEEATLYFEAAAVIVTLVLLGQVLELRARGATRSAIRGLLALAPKTARKLHEDGSESDVPLAHVASGDRLRVRPGERLPVDGILIEGSSSLDESSMTGEAMLVEKKTGDRAIGGTQNGAGGFVLRAERVGEDTLLARIVRMVTEAQRSRAPIQKLVDKVSAFFVPAVLFVAAGTFAWWAFLAPSPSIAFGFSNAIAVLIIACPCALGLATPMSIMVGTGRGARAGVLIRDAEALDAMEKIDTLVLDKTGTLTEGRPRLVRVIAAPAFEGEALLRYAASLERGSEHPLAQAILAGAEERGIAPTSLNEFRSHTGKGIEGKVEGRRILLGNELLLTGFGIETKGLFPEAEAMRRDGSTVAFLAVDGRAAGALVVADPIKESAFEALRELQAEGISPIMVTGDHPVTAQAVARQLGIELVFAGVLPDRKGEIVAKLRAEGRRVAMAGDGTNDAPALAAATVGIAMGTGTDIAIESASVTLMRGDLRGIVRARKLSRATMRNIRQNLFFAFVYNALGVPLAAGALYGLTGWLLSPMVASAAMSLSSASVVANSLRLRRISI